MGAPSPVASTGCGAGGPSGRATGQSIRIVDPERGNELPPGHIGEVFLRSHDSPPGGSCRYVGAEPLTSTPDGFSTLGDVGHLDADGYLFLADRRADLILSGGVNVYPAEVEAVLLQHPAVADAVVVGLADVEWGQRVHGVVLPAPGSSAVDIDDVLQFCRAHLSGARIPKSLSVALGPFRDEVREGATTVGGGGVRRDVWAGGQPGALRPLRLMQHAQRLELGLGFVA